MSIPHPSVRVTYIDLLNATDGWIVIKRNCQRIENLLANKLITVNATYRKTSGKKRKDLDDKIYKLSIRRYEPETVESLKLELKMPRKNCQNGKQNTMT